MLREFLPLKDPNFQAHAQARVRRAEQRHKHPEGFETEAICMGDIETREPCDVLPEWHVEQLDGTCFFACRQHGIKTMTLAKPIPLQKDNWIGKN